MRTYHARHVNGVVAQTAVEPPGGGVGRRRVVKKHQVCDVISAQLALEDAFQLEEERVQSQVLGGVEELEQGTAWKASATGLGCPPPASPR